MPAAQADDDALGAGAFDDGADPEEALALGFTSGIDDEGTRGAELAVGRDAVFPPDAGGFAPAHAAASATPDTTRINVRSTRRP
jgi:hypothetical protein